MVALDLQENNMSNVYVKDISKYNKLDIYRILALYEVKDPCIQHAVKKLLCAGLRNGKKPLQQDYEEAIESIKRALEMIAEDSAV